MVAPAHYRITYSGVFGTAAAPYEDWAMGVSVGPEEGPFLGKPELITAAAAAQSAWASSMASQCGTQVVLTRTRVAHVSDQGGRLLVTKDLDGAYLQGDSLTNTTGTGGATLRFPPQISVAVTM